MATATYPGAAGNTAKTEAATFIPEIWSDEIIAAYQKNLKMAPLVKKLAMSGKKGDKLHIPKPTRGDANAKAADTAVTIIANTESELTVDIDRHFEYSRLIEDIVEVQALNSLRQFYTEDAGYALATKIDTDLHAVSTGFGGVQATPEGGFATTLSPEQAEQQRKLQALTGTLLGGMGAGVPDVSGIQEQALGGVGGFLTGAMAPMAQREADVYERIRATQRPEEQRAQLALEERLAAQGRTGLRTAQFGGSPEQLALAQAQEEAKARASLGALGQAQAEQLQQAGLAESMFGLGSGAAALPASLQQGELGNIGAALGLQYLPEQQLLGALDPAINLANIAGTGQRQGAGYLAQAGTTGLEALGQTEIARANLLRDLYSGLLAQQTNAQTGERQESIAGGLFGDLLSGIGSIFGGQ